VGEVFITTARGKSCMLCAEEEISRNISTTSAQGTSGFSQSRNGLNSSANTFAVEAVNRFKKMYRKLQLIDC